MSNYFIENYMDEYDVLSMEQHKYVHSSHSGKGRSKKEAETYTNRRDPGGHTRKAVQKLINNHHHHQHSPPSTKPKRSSRSPSSSSSSSSSASSSATSSFSSNESENISEGVHD